MRVRPDSDHEIVTHVAEEPDEVIQAIMDEMGYLVPVWDTWYLFSNIGLPSKKFLPGLPQMEPA